MSRWERLIPPVQIYLSVHHQRHGSHGPFRHMATRYLEASGDCLDDMLDHIEDRMKQGLDAVIDTMTKT